MSFCLRLIALSHTTSTITTMDKFTRGAVRGIALFLGVFSLLNVLVSQFGTDRLENIWWVDLSFLPPWLATLLSLGLAVGLVGFALFPRMHIVRRHVTSGLGVTFVFIALINTVSYYWALFNGTFIAHLPIPFSLVIAGVMVLVTRAVRIQSRSKGDGGEWIYVAAFAALGLVLFPLGQMIFFGSTDYRAKADVAVVFGARVYPNLALSTTVKDRVDTAIDLYDAKLVPKILLTGGLDADGIDETEGMRNYAIGKGVPAGAIIIDNLGNNTDLSVINTAAIIKEKKYTRVLAVSQAYHLPRIKMAYRAQHINVRTVPAKTSLPIPQTPAFMMREVPAFWVYWLRGGVRDLRTGDTGVGKASTTIIDKLRSFMGF